MVETTTQYIEYLFDDDQEADWEDEEYKYEKSGLALKIRTRQSAIGISRVSIESHSNAYFSRLGKQPTSWGNTSTINCTAVRRRTG